MKEKTLLELINACWGVAFTNPVAYRELEARKMSWILNTRNPYHIPNVDYLK